MWFAVGCNTATSPPLCNVRRRCACMLQHGDNALQCSFFRIVTRSLTHYLHGSYVADVCSGCERLANTRAIYVALIDHHGELCCRPRSRTHSNPVTFYRAWHFPGILDAKVWISNCGVGCSGELTPFRPHVPFPIQLDVIVRRTDRVRRHLHLSPVDLYMTLTS